MGSEKDDEGYRDDITATVLFFPFLPGQQDAEPLDPEKVPAADSGLARERRGSNESGSTGKRGPGIPAIARARRNSDQSETSHGSGTRNTSDPSKEASPAPGRNSLFAKRDKKRMTFGAEVVDVSRRSANETVGGGSGEGGALTLAIGSRHLGTEARRSHALDRRRRW